jgi:hypothetical protein
LFNSQPKYTGSGELSARGAVTKTELPTFEQFTDLVGLPEIREQERRYAACGREG